MTREIVTVELAVQNLISGLLEIPDTFSQVGCRFADPKARQSHYTAEIEWGRQFAVKLRAMSAKRAIAEIRAQKNRLANLDPRGWHTGKWAHVALMVDAGSQYSLVDGGVVQQLAIPRQPRAGLSNPCSVRTGCGADDFLEGNYAKES